jgi:hypothetical protein
VRKRGKAIRQSGNPAIRMVLAALGTVSRQ